MAGFAHVAAGNMATALADRGDAIMTTEAGCRADGGMIKYRRT